MDLKGGQMLVIGGADLIGSHLVEQPLGPVVRKEVVCDNLVHGSQENSEGALPDSRSCIFRLSGDILPPDILCEAVRGMKGVFHPAVLWFRRCHECPHRSSR